jgi:hypothetical protein
MSKKLDKLKEVNMMLTEVLSKLETQIFIEGIDNTTNKKIKDEQPKVMVELK